MINEAILEKIAGEVADEYGYGGLSHGLYFDYARDILIRYLEYQKKIVIKKGE